jgi:hypothetical protein
MSSEGDGTKQIKPVSTDLKGRKPFGLAKSELAGSRSETVLSHVHRTGGHQVDGINPANVHTTARSTHYASKASAEHRARERSQPYPGKR